MLTLPSRYFLLAKSITRSVFCWKTPMHLKHLGHISGELFCVHHQTRGRKNTSWKNIYLHDSDRLTLFSTMTWARSEPSNHTIVHPMTGHVTILTQACCRVRTQQAVMASHADAVFWIELLCVSLTLKWFPCSVGYTHVISPRIQTMYCDHAQKWSTPVPNYLTPSSARMLGRLLAS